MKTKLEAALEYLDRGWSIIPIKPEGKRPAIKWREYQVRQPTHEEVEQWWTQWPDYDIAIITGAISGVVVVDCDNDDAAHAAFDASMRSPIKVKTKMGIHLYFENHKELPYFGVIKCEVKAPLDLEMGVLPMVNEKTGKLEFPLALENQKFIG